jgi:hypothetical protein
MNFFDQSEKIVSILKYLIKSKPKFILIIRTHSFNEQKLLYGYSSRKENKI